MASASGSIAFVGYSADSDDGLAFVVLEPVLAGSVITFTSAEAGLGGAAVSWNWTAASDVAPGTVVTMSGLAAGQATSNLGTVEAEDGDVTGSIGGRSAHIGSSTAPTFLAQISNDFINPATSISAQAGSTASARAPNFAGADSGAAATGRSAKAQMLAAASATSDSDAQPNPAHEGATEAPAAQPGDAQPAPQPPGSGDAAPSNPFSDADDSLTNTETQIGGISMRGGNDTLVNSGAIVATDGPAIDMGDGDDSVTLLNGSNVYGQILLGAGNDTLTAVAGDLDIDAGAGNDTVSTGKGDDLVKGGAGDDVLDGGEGDDALQGGNDNDRLLGRLGDDILMGDAGDDVLTGGEGNDTLIGGDGVDTADYSAETSGVVVNLLTGKATGEDAGNDTLSGIENVTGGKGADTIKGDGAANVIRGGDGADTIDGGDGNDTLYGDAGSDTLHGGAGDDRIFAGGGADYVYGDAGNDTAYGSDGNDEIHGGGDNDQLHGEGGDDKLFGDAGNDTLYGGVGSDTLNGGDGNDQVFGQEGNDTLTGGAGFDKLHGGTGVDTADYSGDSEGIYVRLDHGWATAQSNRLPSWTDLVAGINGNTIEHDDLIEIENITGTAFNDVITGDAGDNVIKGGAGGDYLAGLGGNDTVEGGAGNDRITAGAGDVIRGDEGNDLVEVSAEDGAPASIDGGADEDTIRLTGVGAGSLGAATNVEKLIVEGGGWSIAGSASYDEITIKTGGTVTSGIIVDNNDQVSIEAGGKLSAATAITWQGGGNAVIDNAGTIEGATRVLANTADATGSLEFNNLAGGVIRGAITPNNGAAATAVVTLNNAGLIEANASGRVIDFQNFDNAGGHVVINNLAGGTIRNFLGSGDADVIRPGQNATINNWGLIKSADGLVGGGDLIDFQEGNAGGKVNNYATGWMEGSKHAVTGEKAVAVYNEGTMIGRNGSAVNIDNGGAEADRVTITNKGTMEGRSAELADSDGDAIDVDGLLTLMNYGRVRGLGAEGYHDDEPNVSEGIAMGGGTIVNNASAEIYGYGRGIQVDNSSNANALGKTLIVNDGLIQGDGHGPEGVSAADAARFNLRGNEAINLVGNYADEIINNSAGRIIGGLSMGGGNDHLSNSGAITATGGSAIDMGAGDDVVNLYVGSTVQGTILLGDGNDRITMNGGLGAVTLDAGNGNDDITTSSGNDVIHAGAGNDYIFAESGNDTIDAGSGDDTILADEGNDVIDGGAGFDTLFLARATGPVYVDFAAGHVSGAGIGFDTFTNIENLLFGEGSDTVTGGNGDDSLDGAGGNDTLNGGAGDDTLAGSAGSDALNGGSGDDSLDGGADDDHLSGGSGDDHLFGRAGNDVISAGSGDDHIEGGAGDDMLTGGSGSDSFVFAAGFGKDTITDFDASSSNADVIEFSHDLFAGYAAAMASAAQVGTDVVFTIDEHHSLTLANTQLGALGADDFRFA